MTILGLFLADLLKDTALSAFWLDWRQRRQQDENLRQWNQRPEVPVIGWYLAKQAGYPRTRFERIRQKTMIRASRWLVNSKTFEHLLGFMFNKNSGQKRRRARAGKSGIRRFWPEIKVVS